MKKIIYIGYLSDINNDDRKSAPSADTKMKYIMSAIKQAGYDIEVISCTIPNKKEGLFKKHKEYITNIDGVNVTFVSGWTSKIVIFRYLGRWFSWLNLKKMIKKKYLKENAKIIIYHSLSYMKLLKFLNKNHKEYILEVEEIYGDVIGKKRIRQLELNYLTNANGYIFPMIKLNDLVNKSNKNYVVVHGTYKIETKREKLYNDDKIHCIYAGTFDPKKGVIDAINSALYLDKEYQFHILGFGDDEQTDVVKKEIERVSKLTSCKVIYGGLLYGEDYIKVLQSCDIGLSPQNPNAEFNDTSFPSKILTYMSNGLKVVSIKIPAIASSDVGDYLYYYKNQEPKEIADAIKLVDLKSSLQSEKILEKLNEKFISEIKQMLGE